MTSCGSLLSQTEAYATTGDVQWVAQKGEWYREVGQEAGFALAVWEFHTPENEVWLLVDDRLQFFVNPAPPAPTASLVTVANSDPSSG